MPDTMAAAFLESLGFPQKALGVSSSTSFLFQVVCICVMTCYVHLSRLPCLSSTQGDTHVAHYMLRLMNPLCPLSTTSPLLPWFHSKLNFIYILARLELLLNCSVSDVLFEAWPCVCGTVFEHKQLLVQHMAGSSGCRPAKLLCEAIQCSLRPCQYAHPVDALTHSSFLTGQSSST